jgi:PhnB protein
MPERNLPDQLNDLIDQMLANHRAPGEELEALLAIAVDLRDLPRPEFKARLKTELERRANMSAPSAIAVTPIRKGFHTVTPYLIARQGAEMIDFVKQVFGAQEMFRSVGSAGGFHAEVKIGDSMMMMGGGLAYEGPGFPAAIHYYVQENPDEVYQRALRLGAASLHEPTDHEYGERGASIEDPFGNKWYIARSFGPRYVPEGLRDLTLSFHPKGAPKFMEFLQQAFAGEVVSRHESPDGTVRHATVRVGDSIVEIGEAHGPYQTMATTTYLYVPNVDEVYRTALSAGATSLSEPADQPYGDRNAGVKDPWGHTWYIATHIKDVSM